MKWVLIIAYVTNYGALKVEHRPEPFDTKAACEKAARKIPRPPEHAQFLRGCLPIKM